MEKKQTTNLGAIIAALCIVTYLGALVYATVGFYFSIENTRKTAEREFSWIANAAGERAANEGFMTQRYIENIKDTLISSKYIEAIIISGPDGEYAFEKQRHHAVSWINNSPRFINKFVFSNIDHFRLLSIPDMRDVKITGVANAFDLNEFTSILKITLLIILIGFATAFFTLLLQLLSEKHGKKVITPVYTQPAGFENHYGKELDIPYPDMKHPEIGPKGLFSPRSNIGWEEYINDRLESELHRCSSTEKDLVFTIIEFNDLTNDSMFKQSAEEAVLSYTSRDLVFEFGRWGIAVILPGLNLEDAIAKSEHFYQQIMNKFPRGYNQTTNLFIGLTSRAGRLLNANRMIMEAKEALKKARGEKITIIAFKSDPDKYREFISRN
ncbi:MAG: hypothetical protein LBC80_00815 [Treponema sp.]|jgi:GGDEF domain-containing protein|nr:hypothetical protein [Treponema sp.]